MDVLWHAVEDTLLMAWQVFWPLVLGFTISAAVQAWAPKERVQRTLGGSGLGPVSLATALGAASSSCSYAAVAIARSIFEKGASMASALAFELASTNLVIELGIVMWVLLGWQFTLAEFIGGLVMIALMALLLRAFVPRTVERRARDHVTGATGGGDAHDGHPHHSPPCCGEVHGGDALHGPSRVSRSRVAANLRHDVGMVWKEILLGLLLAGFIAQIHPGVVRGLSLPGAPAAVRTVESALVGPLLAAASFVCSIGNVPLAAVLWSDGMAFAGVISFLFGDLIVVPVVLIYRKYYGGQFAWRLVALLYSTMVLAALAVDAVFSGAGLVRRHRPPVGAVFPSIGVNAQLLANILAALLLAMLFWSLRPFRTCGRASGVSVDTAPPRSPLPPCP